VQLLSQPLITLQQRLGTTSDHDRSAQAVAFACRMAVLWFLIEVPLFMSQGLKPDSWKNVLFFLVEFVLAFITLAVGGILLHLFFKILRVASELNRTLAGFLYTSFTFPIYAILAYPADLLEYSQVHGRFWVVFALIMTLVLDTWVFVVVIVLARLFSRLYQAQRWRCYLAVFVLFVFIGVWEKLFEPIAVWIERLFRS
jgi:hypothetical protein